MDPSIEAIQLVQHMNDSRYASVVPEISKRLQRLQLSHDGWAVADAMLATADVHVMFYGALTFQIKLNRDGKSLSANEATSLVSRLISWTVQMASRAGTKLVLDKLCSTLSTYFIQSPVHWDHAVRQMLVSFVAEEVVDAEHLEQHSPSSDLVRQLSTPRLSVLVRFCKTLAEDVANTESSSPQ